MIFRKTKKNEDMKVIKVIKAKITRDKKFMVITVRLDEFITKSMPKLRHGDSITFKVYEMTQDEYEDLPAKPEEDFD
jgi:hypothetical protein